MCFVTCFQGIFVCLFVCLRVPISTPVLPRIGDGEEPDAMESPILPDTGTYRVPTTMCGMHGCNRHVRATWVEKQILPMLRPPYMYILEGFMEFVACMHAFGPPVTVFIILNISSLKLDSSVIKV